MACGRLFLLVVVQRGHLDAHLAGVVGRVQLGQSAECDARLGDESLTLQVLAVGLQLPDGPESTVLSTSRLGLRTCVAIAAELDGVLVHGDRDDLDGLGLAGVIFTVV